MSCKMLFKGNGFKNVDGNYYHLKPQTWHISRKFFLKNYDVLCTVENVLQNVPNDNTF